MCLGDSTVDLCSVSYRKINSVSLIHCFVNIGYVLWMSQGLC